MESMRSWVRRADINDGGRRPMFTDSCASEIDSATALPTGIAVFARQLSAGGSDSRRLLLGAVTDRPIFAGGGDGLIAVRLSGDSHEVARVCQ